MKRRKRVTRDALAIVDQLYLDGRPPRKAELEQELLNARVAHEVYRLRARAGLTQRQLAERVGTTASVICRLEDNDYGGHSLNMLQRIAFVLGQRVEVRFKPIGPPRPSQAHPGRPKIR
jgi:ribosome-binding protein aMBF1 (putative translation factor)